MKKSPIVLIVLLFAVLAVVVFPRLEQAYYRYRFEKENEAALAAVQSHASPEAAKTESKQALDTVAIVPDHFYLKVPFFCQAPHENSASWEIHHASCEEAAVLQAVYYDRGVQSVSKDTADAVLRSMIDWQVEHFKVHKDIHADSIKIMMTGFFGYRDDEIKILRAATIDDIKSWVARGFPVIAPTYGRLLRNPYYKQPGPEYHMVTVVGYTEDRLITNDVGTKRGKDFTYDFKTFQTSMNKEGGDCLVIVRK